VKEDEVMDHYIPKRRIPVTLWSDQLQGASALVFLDLDATGSQHQTIFEMLNESPPFLPVAMGEDGRIHLLPRRRLIRVTPERHVVQADVYARGFQPWREERAEMLLSDGTRLSGNVWMPLERESQRLSDYLNRLESGFLVLTTKESVHLINAAAVAGVELAESAGAPLLRAG
jgi:hypothetical protein